MIRIPLPNFLVLLLALNYFVCCVHGMENGEFESKHNGIATLNSTATPPVYNNLTSPPNKWQENWRGHTQQLTLVYWDDHVAFYFDSEMNKSITWPFDLLSRGWQYSKEMYGPFGPDPILNVVLHAQKHGICEVSSRNQTYFDSKFSERNIIDCGHVVDTSNHGDYAWREDTSYLVNKLIKELGWIILKNARAVSTWKSLSVSRWTLQEVITYDILITLGRSRDAGVWKEERLPETLPVPRPNTFWFRDWYIPLYTGYGGVTVLANFLKEMNAYWPHKKKDKVGYITVAQFVHLWSGAANQSLWYLAETAFGWTAKGHKQYFEAKRDYPLITYSDTFPNTTIEIPGTEWKEHWADHARDLNLVYVDSHVAIYFDSQADGRVTWPFKPLSDGWANVKRTFGPFGPDPMLYVILHYHSDQQVSLCYLSRSHSYVDTDFENRTVIDCELLFGSFVLPGKMDALMTTLGETVLRGAKETGQWPAFNISKYYMREILLFDIYNEIGMIEEGVSFLNKSMRLSYPFNKEIENLYWMRDWHYPIYAKFGHTRVLQKFLAILNTHWPKVPISAPVSMLDGTENKRGWNYVSQLNLGEFVHFWSGAAGVDLKNLALTFFKRDPTLENQLEEAKKSFPGITYTNFDIDNEQQPLLLSEHLVGRDSLLFLVHTGKNIAIYFEARIHRSVEWPSLFLDPAWEKVRSSYTFLKLEQVQYFLYVFLHGDHPPQGNEHTNSRCHSFWNSPKNVTTFSSVDLKIQNLIDCEAYTSQKSWTTETEENLDSLVAQFPRLIHSRGNSSEDNNRETEVYDYAPMSQMIVIDLYLRLGRIKDAYRNFKNTFKGKEIQSESGSGRFWIRDWYGPMYTMGGGVSVLNRFLQLLATEWDFHNKIKPHLKLNSGEFVHFWSAAAGLESGSETGLQNLTLYAFEWNDKLQSQLLNARKRFSHFNGHYTCNKCDLHKSSTGNLVIIGVGLSGFILLGLSIFFGLFILHRRQMKSLRSQILRELTADEVKEFLEGTSDMTKKAGGLEGHAEIEAQPFNRNYEIPADNIQINRTRVLGSGEFGLVLYGTIKKGLQETPVAIKTVKSDVDVELFKTLLMELKVLGHLGRQEFIASLLGAVTVNIKKRELFIALEFCAKGDLLGHLKSHRSGFNNLFSAQNPSSMSPNSPLNYENVQFSMSTIDLLGWSEQISCGMVYIGSRKVIHGDLAARNVLVTADDVAKISDFGLSRQLTNYSNYMKKSKTPVPWRWMAIESLRDMNFSVQSDIWSFGVTLFEIFSLGTIPYAGSNWNHEFLNYLRDGHRLGSPEFGNDRIYDLMLDCMKEEPSKRITFPEITVKLQAIKSDLSNVTASAPISTVSSNYNNVL